MNSSIKLSITELTASGTDPIQAILSKISTPIWNRLEARPRGEDITRSLKVEVRDAAWMLCRQWQMGEFAADDAGTPVYCNLQYNCSLFNQDKIIPLEPKIESQLIFPESNPDLRNLNIRLQMGNQWLRLLEDSSDLKSLKESFLSNKEFDFPSAIDETTTEVRQFLQFYKGRSLDGFKLLNYYKDKTKFSVFGQGKSAKLISLYDKFTRWYLNIYVQPKEGEKNSWNDARMEYSFEASAIVKTDLPASLQTKTVIAEEYYHGRVDWYNFNLKSVTPAKAGVVIGVQEREYNVKNATGKKLIPTPVRFDGMPESRFWAIEDGATNFASVNVDRNNIVKLALIEFGLIYSNDWSIVPIEVPPGCFVDIKRLSVIDSFGKESLISSVNNNSQGTTEWSFFSLVKNQIANNNTQDNSLFIPQSIVKSQQASPLEEIIFMRDEMANMVWAIETIVPSPLGTGISGRELITNESVGETSDKFYYLERTNVPVNWIPFIPFKNREGRLILRRGKMINEAAKTVRPNTSLLRLGLDKDNTLKKDVNGKAITYDIEENEVSREGIKVTKSYQRSRWTNGEILVWLGMQKEVGKREGLSKLSFDQLVKRDK